MSEVTQILSVIEQGDPHAASQLLPLLYDELHALVAQRMAKEAPGQTLQPTALVHEAYIRLIDVEQAQQWNSRGHFFAAAAEAMRRILVEHARRKGSLERGGGRLREELADSEPAVPVIADDLVALDEALTQMDATDSVAAQLVQLRYFAGLTSEQAAEALGISATIADRTWAYARAWLLKKIQASSRSGKGATTK